MKKFFENFLKSDQILENEPMSRHTTFGVGGTVDLMLLPQNEEQIKLCLEVCESKGIPFYVIGNGSNLLVSDNGIRGVVIKISSHFSDIVVNGNTITAKSGALLSKIAADALANSLSGFEFASGIPGTLGGAICMNAGAYGGEMKDVVKRITVIDNGESKTLNTEDAEFEYRSSAVAKKGMIVLSAEIELKKGNPAEISALTEDLKNRRVSKQPLNFRSAGSTFKRPPNAFAGKLIEDAGLKGLTLGGAQVSEKHCGFIINTGNATAKDIKDLIEKVKDTVYKKFDIKLCEEVRIIGDFPKT